MEIESLHKYINLNKLANGTTEVMFAGQPCLHISETAIGSVWHINPVFAKLVYGANIFEDIPMCFEGLTSTEEAIASGLIKLHELGAFRTEVDFPEDTYAATMTQVQEEVKAYAIKNTSTIMESSLLYRKVLKAIDENQFAPYNQFVEPVVAVVVEEIIDTVVAKQNSVFDTWAKSKIVEQFNANDFYLVDKMTKKIVRNLGQKTGEADQLDKQNHDENHVILSGKHLNRTGYAKANESVDESMDDAHEQWKSAVQKAHPTVKLKFKGYIEDGKDNISAEDAATGRTHGVWDNDKNKGHIFATNEETLDEKDMADPEMSKRGELVKAIKKDKKFVSTYGKDGMNYAKAKEMS